MATLPKFPLFKISETPQKDLINIAVEYYSDRFLVYIDNSESDFILNNDERTSNKQLNQKLDQHGALNIHQWLHNARPTDRDGDIYLNRYYVVQFSSSKNDFELLA